MPPEVRPASPAAPAVAGGPAVPCYLPRASMPIFDFQCDGCGHRFEELVSASEVPTCPSCGSRRLEKQLSAFSVGKSSPAAEIPAACRSCGDPRGPGGCGMSS
jgi:putative FmdB family regulatory protein